MSRDEGLQRVTTADFDRDETAVYPGTSRNGNRRATSPADFEIVADQRGTRLENEVPQDPPKPSWWERNRKWVILGVVLAILVGLFLAFGLPYIREYLDTVSTDDAFVSGHITNVSPRISGVITEVLVDQNDRVEPGMLLLRIDREPFVVALNQSQASRDQAQAELVRARTQVKTQLATARGNYYRRKTSQDMLRQQIATLKSRVADRKSQESSLALAQVDQRRLENLVRRGSASQSELDTRNNTLKVSEEGVKAADAAIQALRAGLGLAPNQDNPLDIPDDLVDRQSSVQSAVSDTIASLAQIGIEIDPKDTESSKSFEDFLRPKGNTSAGEGLEMVIEKAPAVMVAKAALEMAESDLANARLNLSYSEIRSEVFGHVQDRSVNPGNYISPGQTLLSVRPDYVWIEANYKETQIQYFQIGHPVDLVVDAYPDKVFHGRVAGFSPGTGLSESLLPPQNATGNYVKVTQRLPVRIELTEDPSPDTPLFIGLSVVPSVRFKEKAEGSGAGTRLHTPRMTDDPDVGKGPAGNQPRNRPEAVEARP